MKQKQIKKLMLVSLFCVALAALLALSALAADAVSGNFTYTESGYGERNIEWQYDGAGTLTVKDATDSANNASTMMKQITQNADFQNFATEHGSEVTALYIDNVNSNFAHNYVLGHNGCGYSWATNGEAKTYLPIDYYCPNIVTVWYKNCTDLGSRDYMFVGMEKLTTMMIGSDEPITGEIHLEKVTKLNSNYLFYGDYAIKKIYFPTDREVPGLTEWKDAAVTYCTSLVEIVLPQVTIIRGNPSFGNLYNLTKIEIPSTCKKIYCEGGADLFRSCGKLTTIILNEGLEEIGKLAFKGAAITSITIPSTVTSIDSTAFDTSKVKNITFNGNDANVLLAAGFAKDATITTSSYSVLVALKAAGYTTVTSTEPAPALSGSVTQLDGTNKNIFEFCFDETAGTLTVTATSLDNAWYACPINALLASEDFKNAATIAGKSVKTLIFGGDNFATMSGTQIAALNSYCPNIEKVIFPISVYRIGGGSQSFSGMTKLKALTVSGKETVDYIDFTNFGTNNGYLTASDGNIPNNIFNGCSSITKVVLPAETGLPFNNTSHDSEPGVVKSSTPGSNFRYMTYIPTGMFEGCTSLSDINFPAWIKGFNANSFKNCTSLKRISISSNVEFIDSTAFEGSGVTEILFTGTNAQLIIDAFGSRASSITVYTDNSTAAAALEAAGFTVASYLSSLTYSGTTVEQTSYGSYKQYSWFFSGETRTLGIKRIDSNENDDCFIPIATLLATPEFISQVAEFGDYVETIEFANLSILKGQLAQLNSYCPNLKRVILSMSSIKLAGNSGNGGGLFSGCKSLEIVCTTGNEDINYVDFSKVTHLGSNGVTCLDGYLKNSSAIKKVVLPETKGLHFNDGSGNVNGTDILADPAGFYYVTYIPTSMFEGCSSLETVNLPSWVTGFKANAFKNCTSLKLLVLESESLEVSGVDATAFEGCENLTILCKNEAVAAALNAVLPTSCKAVCMSRGMSLEGFAVRVNGYNGLRTHFSFNESANSELTGLTLVEYGTLAGTKENFEAAGDALIDTTTLSAANKIVKTVVFDGTDHHAKARQNTDGSWEFTVAIVNFDEERYDSEIRMYGYEIWEDSDGKRTVIYTMSDNPTYKDLSLSKVTIGYVTKGGGAEYLSASSDSPMWTIITKSAYKAINAGDDITGYLVADPTDSLYNYAIYATSAESATLGDFGFTGTDKKLCRGYIYGSGVTGLATAADYPLSVSVGPYYKGDEDMAQHPQGSATDGEYLYVSFTGMIVKVRLSDGKVMGRLKCPNNSLSAHIGDITYYDGYLYGSLGGWGMDKCYICMIDVNSFKEDEDIGAESMYVAYLPEGKGFSGSSSIASEYALSDGSAKYGIGGIDGIAVGNIPGCGYIDESGVSHTDNEKYLLVAFSGGVENDDTSITDDYYDNDNYMIGAFSISEIQANKKLASEAFENSETATASKVTSKYRMFIYTGACRYGAQTLAVDLDTGDYILNMYDRLSDSPYPSNSSSKYSVFVIDGSKKLTYKEIEVGQSSSNAAAQERAKLYLEDGKYPTELFMTFKCTCELCDIESHEAVAYGDTGYAVKFCKNTLGSYSNGCTSLGDGYYYLTTISGDDHKDGWTATTTRAKLVKDFGSWYYK